MIVCVDHICLGHFNRSWSLVRTIIVLIFLISHNRLWGLYLSWSFESVVTACGDQIGLGHFNRSYGRGLITWVACHSNGLQCSYVLTMITTYTITFKCNYASRTLTIILIVYGSENKFQIFYGIQGYTIDYANTKAKKLPSQESVAECLTSTLGCPSQ